MNGVKGEKNQYNKRGIKKKSEICGLILSEMKNLEKHFEPFRINTIGHDQTIETPYGVKNMIYADWIASGRLYGPIEKKIVEEIGPYVGNTHSESSETGKLMTQAYHYALNKIKEHVNAGPRDVIITAGSGMTTVINKFQRILGLRVCGKLSGRSCLDKLERPVVFITHMEHHSNHTSWFETIADVIVLEPDENLLVSPDSLRSALEKHKDRKLKIGSFSACSNVTGIKTPYYELARIMHQYGGACIVDFAASAPYVEIDMHPEDPDCKLDAVMFSPHKFLGGPGSSGVLVFDSAFYKSQVPDNPGGGTVDWTNPWGEYKYIDDIEVREDGGTPGFLQAMKAYYCIMLKNQMKPALIEEMEVLLLEKAFDRLGKIKGLRILADNVKERLGIISFYVENIHYNLIVRLLNDRFGIQVRGGCACAGTYGHFLLNVDYEKSKKITEKISHGDLSEKPGWVRLSLHPTMTGAELDTILDAIAQVVEHIEEWSKDYTYNAKCNEFFHNTYEAGRQEMIEKWFSL